MGFILAVDDDTQVLTSIRQILEKAEYKVVTAPTGQEALDLVERETPDLIILDILMPEMSGLEVCRRLRADPFHAKIPIIFLTARGRPVDVIEGLDMGADDYLVKPFDIIQLPARVRARLRRLPDGILGSESNELVVGDLRIAPLRMEVQVKDQTHILTPIEHRLLHYLMSHQGQPCSTDQLLEDVWEYPPGTGDPRVVRVHIARLRSKVEPDHDSPQYILNVHGRGYLVRG